MVANIYHSPAPAGPRAARRLGARIVFLAALYCAFAALFTVSMGEGEAPGWEGGVRAGSSLD
jgi:hypothetical protein